MISFEEALDALLDLARPTGIERRHITRAAGRVLAEPVTARRDQPPFAAASMDGYAVRSSEAVPGARLAVAGESQAGARWTGELPTGACIRIFTGAPVPRDCDRVVIQEDVERDGDAIVNTLSRGTLRTALVFAISACVSRVQSPLPSVFGGGAAISPLQAVQPLGHAM